VIRMIWWGSTQAPMKLKREFKFLPFHCPFNISIV
jgi:hypothetical protein